jgi:hypothetical protein
VRAEARTEVGADGRTKRRAATRMEGIVEVKTEVRADVKAKGWAEV